MKDLDRLWVGLVEENKDPDRMGRVKVRVQSVYDDIPIEDIPWANPIKSLSGKSFELPAIGKLVSVMFPNDNIYEPYYMFSDHYNQNIYNRLKNLSDEEYVNYVALLLEHRTQIFADDTNLTIDYQYNKMTIDNESINLELKDGSQKLNIGCKTSSQQAVLGTRFFEWMDKLVDALLKPSSLIGNGGAPIVKAEVDQLLVRYQLLRKDFVSDYVNIVDNRKVEKLKRNPNSVSQAHDGITINNSTPSDKDLRTKIIDQFKKNNDTLLSAVPSSLLKKDTIPQEDPQGSLLEGLSEVPFGYDENGNDIYNIKISELKGTETSFTAYRFLESGDNVKQNEVEVMIPVLMRRSQQAPTYVTPEEAKRIKSKELKDNGIINYETFDDTPVESSEEITEQADPDDIISGLAFEFNTNVFDSVDTDEMAYSYDPEQIYVFKAPDDSLYTDNTTTTSTEEKISSTTNTSKSASKGQKTRTVKGPPVQVIKNGEVPEKYMKKIKVGDKNGNKNGNAMFEKHAAAWFERLNDAYHKQFGKYIYVTDSYRTYAGQVACKEKWIAKGNPGRAATPGTSLHGWGIAVDIGDATIGSGGSISFGSKTYNWLLKYAPYYNFDNPSWARKGQRNSEPWHWEYQGTDIYSVIDV